jgi:predicted DCC family thiol-disulfide oxidoreductase YuxK
VNTEMTEVKNERGWVLFDAQCLLCTRLAHRCGPLLKRYGFALLPLQTPWVRESLAKCDADLLSEMRLLTPQGVIYGGADALAALARQIWWARPLYWLARLPLVRAALQKAYAWIARHRSCLGGRCKIGTASRRYKTRVFFEMP